MYKNIYNRNFQHLCYMTTHSLKAVLFDLDGTLIDSEYFYFSNWAPILKDSFGLIISFDDWIREFAGHTLVRNVEYLKDKYRIDTTEEYMWKRTREAYSKSSMLNVNLMPYAKEILSVLREKGIRIALVTSSYQTTVDAVLGNHGLLDYFEFFVTREKVQQAKPNAEPYLLALSLLGLHAEEVLAVEDTITGTTSAQLAGIQCIAVSKHITERNRLESKADFLYHDLDEVIEHFQVQLR